MGDDRLNAGEGEREEKGKEDIRGADSNSGLDDESWATSG